MFRRSRFSIRPNVGTAGRAAATPQEVSQEASETPKDTSESTAAAVTDNKPVVTPSENVTAAGDGNDQNGEGASSSAAVQRRKRFSIKPKVAPGRPSALARTPKSPVKAVSETPVEVPSSDLDKPTTSSQTGTTAAPQGLQSPRRRRPSEDSKQPRVQPKPNLIISEPSVQDSLEQTPPPVDTGKQLVITSDSQVKEVPPRLPDKAPPSLPDKEAIEISEKAKTLVSSKSGLSLSPPAFSLSRLLNDPSDLHRLAKAQKLRELLKQEMHKEKKSKKGKTRVKEYTLDPAKMTMRDLIRYLPVSNPMTSSLEDTAQENETVVPPSPRREESPEKAQEPEVPPKITSQREEEQEEEEEDEEEALMVPQVKVAEDGSLIIDEESLTVEVQRSKGPNTVQDRDPIFERGSTTTYSSFRKGTYSKPWSSEETDMFFLAISMVGTDFSMICQLFPHRARSEIKNKFKKEERENAWRIDKAFRDRRKLDIEYFSKLLEKILEVQKNRKKLKSLAEKNSPKKSKRKTKGKKAKATKLSDVEEEDEEEENEIPDLEEGEKENEDLCNEGGTPISKPKKKRKRKNKLDASTEEPNDKKNKTSDKSNEQDEAYIPEDAEAALPEEHTSENTENMNAANDTTIKPAKLNRGRAPKPLLPLGRKWGKKPPPPSTKGKDTESDKGDESVNDGASKEQVNEDASPLRQANEKKSDNDGISSEEEEAIVQPLRPTRYGRVPKPTKPLTYPAKKDAHSSASESTPDSPAGGAASAARPKPKCTAKRGRSSKAQPAKESKRPKLVTLRASQSDYSDEENEKHWEEEEVEEQHPECSSSKDSIAPAFVPASLRSPQPMISEVEETMEELDILANMPDVLGISQDALCPDASCERAHNETGTAEPCEHQLDLLVDVIDFLSEHTEASEDESYNEAAQTLLTIGNLAHLSQSALSQIATEDHVTETSTTTTTTVSVTETRQHLEEQIASKPAAQEENSATPLMSATSDNEVTETVATVELQNSTTDNDSMPITETSAQRTGSDTDPDPKLRTSPESSKTNSPQTRRGRLSKVKPKPNLGKASRIAQSKSQPEASTVRTAEESHTVAPNLSEATVTLSAAEETPKVVDCSQDLLKEEISCIDVRLTEKQSDRQERSVGQVQSDAATSDQSASENQSHSFSDTQFEPSLEKAPMDSCSTSKSDEIPTSHVETTKSSCDNLATSDDGQVTDVDSAPVQESSHHPAACVTPVEDLPVGQKQESEVKSTQQTRKSRFQKVKPKPNLIQTPRTVHCKPQITKDTPEKDSNPTPKPKAVVEVEAEPTCTTSPEKPSQSSGPTSDSIPPLDLDFTLTPTEELSTTEVKKTDAVVFGTTSDQSPSENQIINEAQFEPSREQATSDPRQTSESTGEQLMSNVGRDNSCSNLLTSTTESQVERGSNMGSAPVQEHSDRPAPCITHVEDLPVSQKQESEVKSTCPTRRGRSQKDNPSSHMQLSDKPSNPTSRPESTDNTITEVEEQPTCSTTAPEKPSQIKCTVTAPVSVPPLESCSTQKPQEKISSNDEQVTDVGLDSSSESSQQNVPQRRRRFPKVKPKPNLGSSTRTTQTKQQSNETSKPPEQRHIDPSSNVTLEQQPVDNNRAQIELAEKDSKHSTKSAPAESEKSLDSTSDEGASSDRIIIATSLVAENQSMLTDSVLENKSNEKSMDEGESTREKKSHNDKEEAGPAPQQDLSIRATETSAQPSDDSAGSSDVQASEDGSSESKIKSTLSNITQSTPDPKESARQSRSENESEAQSQDAVKQRSETNPTAAQSSFEDQSEPNNSSKSSKKAPPSRRGRLVKPKPNLRRSSQPPRPQQVQNTKESEADSGARSEGADDSASHKPVSELRPAIQVPVAEAPEQHSDQISPSNVAGPSLGCLTQIPDSSTQDASTSSTEGTQSHPSLTIFPDMLSEQVPSDPDEPFFILSLTEIPVCSSGEVVDSASEPIPYLPVTDASIQQESVHGERLGAVGDGSLSNITMEESAETILINVKDNGPDTAAYVDPHGTESTTVQPSKLPETVESNDETPPPPTKQTLMAAGKRGKRLVKPKKQASKTLAAKEAESDPIQTNTTQDSELPGLSVPPEAVDITSGAQTVQTRGPRTRKAHGLPSFLSETNDTESNDSPPGKAASKGRKVKSPRTAGSTAEPAASTSHEVAPAPSHSTSSITSLTQTEVDIEQTSGRLCSDPSTSQSTAEVSASQQSESMESSCVEEEPTSVSQYFLSDIFTEVEEG